MLPNLMTGIDYWMSLRYAARTASLKCLRVKS